MKITVNMLRSVCAFYLALRDVAEAEGLQQARANAQRGYEQYRDLLLEAYEKRPSGVGAGRPHTWKITFKARVPRTGGDSNAAHHIPGSYGAAPATPPAIP
ncbi:hypothetical protein [Paenibacillus stellifer]|uniref:hypothetical protein n=1 Tax=Paenibacillus stellifer TaxID=169760 RepID=UPI0012EEB0F1|nr:hypothetical protein [Paenibacillus stellifer]